MDELKFNWGIIGPGRIAHSFANGLSVIKKANLSAIASRNKDRADKFAKEFNPDKIYTSYLDLINDPDIDGIYIATPHRFHFDQAILAVNNRKAVLCEKPITVNALELKRLIETARNKNVFLMEALWTRYLPIYNVVRSWLDDYIIGDVKLINSTFGFNIPRDLEDRKFNHELAGGALLDLGIYPVSISQWVMGKNPNKFSANGYLGETNVDEIIAVTLEYDNGSLSQFSCNFLSKNENDFIIYGTKGYIRIHNMFWGSTKATLYTEDSVITESRPFRASGFEYQIEEAMRCIQEGLLESPGMPLDQSLKNIELLDNIRNEIGLKYSFEKD